MKIKVKRFDKNLPLPAYQSKGAVGMDLYCREDTSIAPQKVGYIPLNIALEIPKGHWVLVAARGSSHKHGLMPAHGIGIGDWDFRGDNDEYVMPVFNFSAKKITVTRGTRIAQMLILPYPHVEIEEVDRLQSKDRGKFGPTGLT